MKVEVCYLSVVFLKVRILRCLTLLFCAVQIYVWGVFIVQIFHKSRLCKLRVSPSETAMMDVLREVIVSCGLSEVFKCDLHK